MKTLVLLTSLVLSTPVFASENITINGNKFCADAVGIAYASDNFTDFEWEQFKQCLQTLSDYEMH